MLHNIDINKMHTLMKASAETKQIINQLLENHHESVALIAHEIRNPLTLISSSLQIMEVQHPEVLEFSHWKQMTDDVSFLCCLLTDLSAFNHGDSLNYSVFSMEHLLKNIAVSFAISLNSDSSGIEFTSSVSQELGDYTGDKVKLQEVILNLLRNAQEAITESGNIHLSARKDEDCILIQCKDTGSGIPDEIIDKIFDSFQTYKVNGSGLGLSFSRQVIESHGGSITVQSKTGEGSTFTIRLPS